MTALEVVHKDKDEDDGENALAFGRSEDAMIVATTTMPAYAMERSISQ